MQTCGDLKQGEGATIVSFRQDSRRAYGGTPLKSFATGYLEARVRVSDTRDFFPAVWLLGWKPNIKAWPANGEIDVMEMLKNGNPADDDSWVNAFHWSSMGCEGSDCKVDWNRAHGRQFLDLPTTWHVMGLWRSATEIRIYYDGQRVRTVRVAQQADNGAARIPLKMFTDPMSIVLSAQVCPIGQSWCDTPDAPHEPSDLTVDYLRVWNFE